MQQTGTANLLGTEGMCCTVTDQKAYQNIFNEFHCIVLNSKCGHKCAECEYYVPIVELAQTVEYVENILRARDPMIMFAEELNSLCDIIKNPIILREPKLKEASKMFENVDEPTGRQTEYLLKCISDRLSGRDDCRKVKYTVIIDHNGVRMDPLVYVYPNRYKRKETDLIDIVSFVHTYRMKSALLSNFVFGTYEYELSLDGKKRKWRKTH